MHKIAVLVAFLATLSGCAITTTPIPSSSASPVPADRRLAFQEKTATSTSTMVVTRDEGYLGSRCYLGFLIDKVLSARLAPGETVTFFVNPGEHLIRVSTDPQGAGLCAIDSGMGATRETTLQVGETKYFRLLIDQSKMMDVQRSDN